MIKFECTNCGHKYEYEDDDQGFECISTDERQMGTESEYECTYDFSCETCDQSIEAEFHFWEYPLGALNHSETKAEGCTILKEPDYQSIISEGMRDE